MKDISKVIQESISQILDLLQEFNFHGSNLVSRDLVTVSKLLDYTDGVFVAAVLAAAFGEIDDLVESYEVDASHLSGTRDELQKRIAVLIDYLKEKKTENIYAQLSGITNVVTDLRINTLYTTKRKP